MEWSRAPEVNTILSHQRCWDQVWSRSGIGEELDPLSAKVAETLRGLREDWEGTTVLEAGCGTGRISLELAKHGATVCLLDISSEALRIAAGPARKVGATLVAGNLLRLPFAKGSFDLTWNGGVLEHLRTQELDRAVSEMARVTKHGGLIVSLNPNRQSLPYRAGKRLLERRGAWLYGYEEPIRTLEGPFMHHGIELETEFDMGVAHAFSFFTELPRRARRSLARVEAVLRILGARGYLLVSVGRKR